MLKKWKEYRETRSRRMHRKIELVRLRRTSKKKTPNYSHCKNCGTPLEGMYCYRCGQYASDIEQPFWKYIRQYFENVYQFDTKIWCTLWYMFTRPGFLTAEFNMGKINSYVHPFRLYMCISMVFFTVFFMLVGERANDFSALNDGLLRRNIIEQMKSPETMADTTVYLYQAPRLVKTLSLRFGVKNADNLIRFQPVDNLYGLSRTTLPRLLVDSCFRQTDIAPQDWDFIRQARARKELNIENWIDGNNYGPDNVAAIRAFRVDSIYAGNGTDSLVLQPQKVYIWTDGIRKNAEINTLQKERFINGFVGDLSKWTPFYMMFLLPFFAAMLKLFYRSSRMPYMWHFVHAIHLNTVFLILLCIPLVPFFAYGIDEILAAQRTLNAVQLESVRITLLGFPIAIFFYMWVSFHTVYRQGWVKTALKALLFFTLFTAIAILLACVLLLWVLSIEVDDLPINEI